MPEYTLIEVPEEINPYTWAVVSHGEGIGMVTYISASVYVAQNREGRIVALDRYLSQHDAAAAAFEHMAGELNTGSLIQESGDTQ